MIDQNEARIGVQRLLMLYCQLIDDLRLKDWGELFCEDATWTYRSHTFIGRANIVAGVGAMEPEKPGMVKHITFAPILDFEGDQVYSWADATALVVGQETSPVVSAGRYYDIVRKTDGRWRFFRRLFLPSGDPVPSGIRPTPGF